VQLYAITGSRFYNTLRSAPSQLQRVVSALDLAAYTPFREQHIVQQYAGFLFVGVDAREPSAAALVVRRHGQSYGRRGDARETADAALPVFGPTGRTVAHVHTPYFTARIQITHRYHVGLRVLSTGSTRYDVAPLYTDGLAQVHDITRHTAADMPSTGDIDLHCTPPMPLAYDNLVCDLHTGCGSITHTFTL